MCEFIFLLSVLSTVCSCDLARSGFFQKKGEYICTADYQRLYGTRCDRCDSFITGEVVSALGRTYHPKCFVCSVCRYLCQATVLYNDTAAFSIWCTILFLITLKSSCGILLFYSPPTPDMISGCVAASTMFTR